jgi:hypothetical protein
LRERALSMLRDVTLLQLEKQSSGNVEEGGLELAW